MLRARDSNPNLPVSPVLAAVPCVLNGKSFAPCLVHLVILKMLRKAGKMDEGRIRRVGPGRMTTRISASSRRPSETESGFLSAVLLCGRSRGGKE